MPNRRSLRSRVSGLLAVLSTVLASQCELLGDPHKCNDDRKACEDAGRYEDSCTSEYESCKS